MQASNCEYSSQLTIIVASRATECFYQHLVSNITINANFHVLSREESETKFWITSENKIIAKDSQRLFSKLEFKTVTNGNYDFCIENLSRMTEKRVYFSLYTNDVFEDPFFPRQSFNMNIEKLTLDQLGEMANKIDGFRHTFSKLSLDFENIQRLQDQFKNYELIDRTFMENNFERVNFWSVLNIVLLVSVGFIQVYMIRSLFEDRSKIGKVLRGKASNGPDNSGLNRSFT